MSGTSLDDLDTKSGPTIEDDDIIQKIYSEMNGPSGGNTMLPPAPSARAMLQAPLPQVGHMSQIAMDPMPATAHMIGGQHPTPADFAHAMHGAPMMGGYQQAPPQQHQQQQMYQAPPAPTNGLLSSISGPVLREFKTPLLVALIVLVMSLPIINTMIGMYLPSLLRMGGDLTPIGTAAKALAGGALFWILQRVVAPLI
jgi:hypothetical protein